MKSEGLTSLDINAWLTENRGYLIDSFIKKYSINEDIKIRFHKKDAGNRDMYILLPKYIYFGERYEMESSQNPFLDNMIDRRIISIEQPNFDRIIRIDLSSNYSIIIEMFGQGNFIFLNNGTIEYSLISREWRGRKISRGELYRYPPSPVDPRKIDIENFREILKNEMEILRFLALKLNLSHYSEYILESCSIKKEKLSRDLDGNEISCIYEKMKSIIEWKCNAYICEDKISILNLGGCEEYESVNKAITEIVNRKNEIDENQKILNEQLKTYEEYKKLSENLKDDADFIMMNLERIDGIIKETRQNRNPDEVVSREGKWIKLNMDGRELDINMMLNSIGNAQQKYEESKKYSEKMDGILAAIERLKSRKVEKEERKVIREERKRFWFEKYRWFISSENAIVIAGRDAKSNEEVVKKYFGEKDYYVHADIHGAPSVVVKNTGITEKTLIEAGIFGVSFSRAWNAGYKVADAYWVTFSQVSKMAESGEYVPRGAWIIRGKRNYMRNLPLRLGIGEIEYQNVKIVMIGPVESFRNKAKKIISIVPGNMTKENAAVEISKKFSISKDEVVRLLPPGNIDIEGEFDVANFDNNNGKE
ncbi:MAG: ribosome rescue protein RqcH [Thermoplasmata archaeon]